MWMEMESIALRARGRLLVDTILRISLLDVSSELFVLSLFTRKIEAEICRVGERASKPNLLSSANMKILN
jgi:hypothetical protein